jgi:hypothetical protein
MPEPQFPPEPSKAPATHPNSSDRAARFLARLDDHLRSLSDPSARRAFLARQQAGWEHRYARFVTTSGASEPVTDPTNPPQAADFVATITGLAARRTLQGDPMSHAHARDRIAPALRSLLVAADQCCPTIIGQAHVLYRLSSLHESYPAVTDSFSELKKAAEELRMAIACAEATLQPPQPAIE